MQDKKKIQDTRYMIHDKEKNKLGILHLASCILHQKSRVSWLMNRASCIVHRKSRASCIVHRDTKGVTLIELVLGMVLIGIVALVVANALSTGITGFFVVDNRKEALDQTRVAMDRMAKEMRNVKSSANIGTANATQFCFKAINNLSDNDTANDDIIISYRYSGNTIIRQDGLAVLGDCPGSGGNTLANSIASFSFTYLKSDGTEDGTPPTNTKRIKINTTSTVSSESVELQTEVWPRNL